MDLKKYWRKLDDQAKIYSLSFNKKDTSVFRLSVVLKEVIEPNILEKALNDSLKKYKIYKMKIQRGFFWYYMENNEKNPVVSEEDDYPFKKVITKENNDYMFKVTYFRNKINIDYFHALTDGNNGAEFLKEVVYRYIELKHPKLFKAELKKRQDIFVETENAYTKNYKKNAGRKYKFPKAYTIKGERFKDDIVSLNHFCLSLNEMKKSSKKYNVSLSVFIVSMIAYSLYEANYRKYAGKKPINICVPVDLKKYFPSETKSNFVSYMMVTLHLKSSIVYTFNDILELVKMEFDRKLRLEKIASTMTSDGKSINNIVIRLIPLAIKKAAVILGALSFKKHFTMTFSNIGRFEIDDKYSKYIENFFFILSPDWAERVRCGVCSYNDSLVVTFGSNIKSADIELKFKELLDDNKINFHIEGNGINVISD